jgi:two-component system, chemotaxis family, sensor kinase CheA
MSDADKLDLSMFIEEYLSDAREGFQEINGALLALEKDYTRTEHLDNVLRTFHTLKSSSNMLNFMDVSAFSHRCEDFMDRLRKREIPIDKDTVDFLFEITDTIEAMVKERTGKGADDELSGVIIDRVEAIKQKMEHLESKEMLSRQGVIVINENGIIKAFNPDAERIFQYPSAGVIGQNVNMLISEPYKEHHDAYISNYIKTGKAKAIGAELRVHGLRKDGTSFPMELAVSDIYVGKKRLFIEIVKDMSVYEIKSQAIHAIKKIQTVKIHVDLIDALFNLVGELIITRNRLNNIFLDLFTKELKGVMISMNHIISELQEKVSSARMVPVEEIFQKFPRMVRDIAIDMHKEVELVTEGSETELDKSVLDEIGEPLMHLLRNAVGHGIELPEIREHNGKKRVGTIKLIAKRTENQILIEVEDDGAGIDVEAIKEIALRKGYVTTEEATTMQEKDALSMLFKPGFSSMSEVTGLSGRGVGLDVVKTATEKLAGTVEIASRKGEGTRFSLSLPIAPAIMQTLMVGVGRHVFVIPSDMVLETMEARPEYIKQIGDRDVFILHNEAIPFIKLKDLLHINTDEQDKNLVAVIIYREDNFIALGVDAVIDQIENIIKPLDTLTQKLKGFSGGTILPDGSVALLLDVPSLFGFETFKEKGYTV